MSSSKIRLLRHRYSKNSQFLGSVMGGHSTRNFTYISQEIWK